MKINEIKRKFETKFNSPENNLVWRYKSGSHHFYDIFYRDRYIGMLMLSHGNQEIGSILEQKLKRQLGISKEDFRNIERCPFGAKEFVSSSKLIDRTSD